MSGRASRSSRPMWAGIARLAVCACAFGLVCLAAPASFGSDRLIIDRVEVPAGRLGEVFPPGTELSVMDRAAFDRLADAAAKAIAKNGLGASGRVAHLLRAEHSARWTGGRLTGTSVLLVRGDPAAETWLNLSPWTPSAIGPGDENNGQRARLRTDREGQVGLWLDRSGAELRVEIPWEQAARPGSGGRAFRLGLPRCAIASIALDLPADLTPEGWSGLTLDDPGPSPVDERGDRRMWRRDGPFGAEPVELHLIAAGDAERASLWVGGPTLIDAGESEARLTASWTVERPAGASDRLMIELPTGLVPLSVDGPAVFAWSEMAEASQGPCRVEVRLREKARDATTLTLRALGRAPERGMWSLPWARPVDAVWMGGRVVVRTVATSREIRAVENTNGRSVPPRPDELEGLAPATSVLVFDPPSAGPVADLIVGPRVPRGVAEVRGQMTLGPGRGVLEGSVSWSLDAGPLLDLGFDLPDPWVLESMVDGERGEAIHWEMEPRPDGVRRARLVRAPLLASSRPFVVRFVAVATRASLAGEWALPRVRPLTLPATGERWSLRVASGFDVEVSEATGLAWEKSAITPRDDDASVRLDWSWTEEDGRARVVVRPRPEPTSTLAVELVRLGKQRAKIDLFLISRGPVPPDPSGFTLDDGPALDWDLDDTRRAPIVNGSSGPVSDRDAASVEAAIPPAITSVAGTETRHRASTRLDWDGSGRLPLLKPPSSCRSRVVVLVALAPELLATDRSRGLLRLDPTFALASIAPGVSLADLDPGPDRLGLAFELRDGSPTLDLTTEALQPCGPGGVIVQARTTCGRPIPGRTGEVRLMMVRTALMALPMGEAPLSLTLPRTARLLMIRVDGRPAEPRSSQGRLLLNLPPGTGLNPSRQVLIDWEVETPPAATLPPPILLDWPTIDPAIRAPLGPDERLELTEPGWAALVPSSQVWPSFLTRLRELSPMWGLDSAVAGRVDATATGPTVDGPGRRGAGAATSAAGTLGGALLRRDAGRSPLVIDRLAMESLGLNARTPTGSSSANPPRSLGLVEERLGDVIVLRAASKPLVTPFDRDQPDSIGLTDWAREAAVTGSSPAGRFLSVSRWLAEPETSFARDEVVVARGVSASRAGSSWLIPTGTGGEATREPGRVRPGFPSRMRAAGLVLLVVLGASLGCRTRAWPRTIALVMVLVAAIPLSLVAATEAAGLLLGAALGVAIWLGAAARRAVTLAWANPKPRSFRGRRPGPGTAVLFAIALLLSASPEGRAQPRPVAAGTAAAEVRIVVISVSGEADRVYLKREDHDVLRDLAATADPDRTSATGLLTARAGTHRVSMEEHGGDGIVVESRYELMLDGGEGPAFWPVPTGSAVDFVTTLDGGSVPLELDAQGGLGRVWARGRGPHTLVVRRNVPAAPADDEMPWSVPVSPTPETLVLGAAAMAENDRLAIAGETNPKAATTTTGPLRLGPVDQLVLSRSGAIGKDGSAAGSRPLIDGLMLWEAQAAGDLIRARWNVRCTGSLSQLRVELSPGAVVRASALPGLVDARLTPGQASNVWTARLDPPWTGTQPVQLDVWVPASSSGDGRDRPAPRVTPLDVEGFSGMMGLRRPGTWSGRLDATSGTGVEVVADEVFARAWGAFPELPATFAGAIRFGSSASASSVRAAIGPVAPSATVQTRLALRTRPGRVELQAELLLTERDGRLRELVLRVPPGLRVDRVQGDGVEVWGRPAPDRLVLRLNSVEAGSRAILLSGWQSVPGHPMSRTSGRDRLNVPWPRPDGLAEAAIQVSVRAHRAAQVELSPRAEAPSLGPVAGPADSKTPTANSDESITHYAWVPLPGDAPMLSWLPESSSMGPNVDVVSVLTVHPTQARWRARLVSEGGPGPLPALSFSLPKDWAGPVTVRTSGVDATFRQVDLDGQTLFTMVPSRPIWGRVAIDLDATRDWSPTAGLSYPDLVPRGPGTATTTFAVANATGGDLVTQGEGISAILLDTDLPFPFALPASLRAGYRVTRAGGTLSLRGPGPRSSPEMARVLSADLIVRADATGATLGSTRVRLLDQPASFLEILAPRGLEPLAALVDLKPVRPLRTRDGRLLMPLDAPHAEVVELAFRTPPPQDATSATASPSSVATTISLPSAGAGVPHRIEIDRPDLAVARGISSTDGFQAASAFDLEFARASDLRRGLLDRLRGFDRSQPSQRVSALEGMIRFEAQARAAERAIAASGASDTRRAELRALKNDFRNDLTGLGLDDLALSAAARTGVDVEDPLPALEPEIAATVSFPIRPVGTVHRLQGEGPGHPIAVEIARPGIARDARPILDLAPAVMLAVSILLVAALGLLTRSRLLAGVAAVLLSWGLTCVAPAFLIAAAAAVLFGALARTPARSASGRAAKHRRLL